MKFTEFLSPNKIKTLGDLGAVGFGPGITDKNEPRTPHYEMNKCLTMYEQENIINSGVNQLALFIIPNEKLKVYSKNKQIEKDLQKWHDERLSLIEEVRNFFITRMVAGNSYIEKKKVNSKNGQLLNYFYSINDASRIFVNPNATTKNEWFVYQLPMNIKSFTWRGKVRTPGFHTVPYIKGTNYMFERVYGFTFSSDELIHWKTGWSRDNLYGRSQLASGIDDYNLMSEIMNSWDTIAKTRQLDRILYTIDDPEGIYNDVDQEKLDELAIKLEDSDKSFTLLNFPLKLVSKDISVSGKYDLMESVYDILRRKIMMSLLPSYLTPWNESGTTQGAEASMPPFQARVKALQNELINFLNEEVLKPLEKEMTGHDNTTENETTYIFDEPKILPDESYVRKITELVRSELISIDEARTMLSDLGIADIDLNVKLQKPAMESFSEAVMKNEIKTFAAFKNRIKLADPNIKTNDWKETNMTASVGGKELRVIETEDMWLIFNGLTMVQSFDKTVVQKQTMGEVFEDYKKKVKAEQDEFLQGETEIDQLTDEFKKEVEEEIEKRLVQLFNGMGKFKSKKEGFEEAFLKVDFLDKVNDYFKDFNSNINKSITKMINKLGVNITSGDSDGVQANDDVKKLIDEKKKLIKDSLKNQINTTKDKMITDIKSQLQTGITAGKSVTDIKRDIRKNFDYDSKVDYKFDRIIHTTTRQNAMLLKLRKWQKLGYTSYVWQTKEDDKVREKHAKKNQRVYNIEDSIKSSDMDAYPGKDFNCRCSGYPYM